MLPAKGCVDRHREADRDRGVDRVAARFQDRHADVDRDRLHGDDHAVPRAHRLTRGVERDGRGRGSGRAAGYVAW